MPLAGGSFFISQLFVRYFRLLALAIPLLFLQGQTPPAPNAYVERDICSTCHSAIAKTYALTGMGRSFYRPQPQTAVEDFSRGNPFFIRRPVRGTPW